MDGLVMTAQMILALSIIVGIHEFGHLITAKIFGMKVEKYFIGFPPKIWSINYKGTEYGLGSIPLGGFVKISGIIDESMDTEHINKPPEPWEFRSKPPWQRLIVMLGGILFNVITGLIIFTIITFYNGDVYLSKDEINKNGILALELGEEVGFITGDKILKINGENWERDTDLFNPNLFLDYNTTFSILRSSNEIDIKLPNNFINKMNSKEALSSFLKARTPFYIDSVFIDGNAYKAGILSGDEKYFQAGLKFYGIALNITRKDGSSSWEIRKQKGKSNRSKRGLLKMTQVVGGMVMIAEVFANQGYDLYSFETKKGVTVHTMIDFLITYLGYPDSGAKKKAYIDPEIMDTKRILKKTGINDNTLGWAHAYIKRFPNKETTKKLIKYYLEPYGWSRYIQNSGGYGMHMSCAYADINKIK